MDSSTTRRRGAAGRLVLAVLAVLLVLPGVASAHEERDSVFPDGSGTTPTHRPFDEDAPRLVVCKPDSAQRIADLDDPVLRSFNESLLGECAHEHLQAAVDAVQEQGTTIYVLPGIYREEPSVEAPCAEDYDGGVVEYDLIVSCGEVINLITVAGDDPADADISCDNQLCDLQIEGTGAVPQDTKVVGGFTEDGDWRRHNGLKADRADGFVLVNMTFELFRENAIYIHETDGYLLDRVEANYNDLYGILTFTSDHGVISNCETHHNGDSGIYPGSAADVNAGRTEAEPLTRWSVEIFGCTTHHNALGFSGTAGNSVWFHDNVVHSNGAGYVTDSFVGGHPGMPQDSAMLEDNLIFGNNVDYYRNVRGDDAPCQAERPADRGYEDGVVCPAFPVPVGTGVLIAGGNTNLIRDNQIFDNWRAGVMLFWVPGAIRGDFDPLAQLDTSNGNRFVDNAFGIHPSGVVQPNGLDAWWDDEGVGNCWQGNDSSAGELTHNSVNPLGLPDCDSGGSLSPVGNFVKSAGLVPCATYNREDQPDPAGCDWFRTPPEPEGREQAPGSVVDEEEVEASVDASDDPVPAPGVPVAAGPSLPATGSSALLLGGLAALGAALRLRRRDGVGDPS